NDYHSKIKELCEKQLIQGLRIDHIDGLADPEGYLEWLRNAVGDSCYTVAEKILGPGEQLPSSWSLQGTTGYDFTAMVNRLFTVPEGFEKLTEWFRGNIPGAREYAAETVANRMKILKEYMAGEWENIYRIARTGNLFPQEGKWKDAIAAFITCMPVYRGYPRSLPLNEMEVKTIRDTISTATYFYPEHTEELLLMLRLFQDGEPVADQHCLEFLQRLMQFTGPLMAKGVEDTSFYTWNAMIARNEVGDSPGAVSVDPVNEFHASIQRRSEKWPSTMNATATHDTKRGEDARIRLLTITEDPVSWLQLVEEWFSLNSLLVKKVNGQPAPSRNEEYFIYQSIVGGFPPDGNISEAWIERVQQYIAKAIKEAKVNTSWDEAQPEYEQACRDFIDGLFRNEVFINQLKKHVSFLDKKARVYSLSQLLLKLTVPGIPDIYQGCELHDYSFVDPDNRREVDYEKRKKMLASIQEGHSLQFPAEPGMDKLFICARTLALRNQYPDLFQHGDYFPLKHGDETGRLSFARAHAGKWLISTVPLPGWKESSSITLQLPEGSPATWINVFSGEKHESTGNILTIHTGKQELPVILLMNSLSVTK
ncbi:MAG: malto-oligosyltrehalose synthase, partial [Pseudobacter sp.]|uniref:malto-oligosyltrehalose synthase n=1 Tax=Pseudobacter sp. TaxID=2045420 RepID=UPI003F821A2A